MKAPLGLDVLGQKASIASVAPFCRYQIFTAVPLEHDVEEQIWDGICTHKMIKNWNQICLRCIHTSYNHSSAFGSICTPFIVCIPPSLLIVLLMQLPTLSHPRRRHPVQPTITCVAHVDTHTPTDHPFVLNKQPLQPLSLSLSLSLL